jgi:four helix bundle protein
MKFTSKIVATALCGSILFTCPALDKAALTLQPNRLQISPAAVSVPSNIAEGQANGPGLRYRYHLRIALGSLAELSTQLDLAIRLHYVGEETAAETVAQLTRARQLLHGLHRSVSRQMLTGTLTLVVLLGSAFAIARLLS